MIAVVNLVVGLARDPATQTTGIFILVVLFFLDRLQTRRNITRIFERQDLTDNALSTLRGAHDTAERLNGCPMVGLGDLFDECPLVDAEGTRRGPGRRDSDVLKQAITELAGSVVDLKKDLEAQRGYLNGDETETPEP